MPDPIPAATVAYQRDEFYRKLSEIQGRLAELRYIDVATGYLESQQAQWWEERPVGSHTEMEFQFGQTVPFTRTYDIGMSTLFAMPWQETKEEEVRRRLGEIAEEASTWASDSIAALRDKVSPLTFPSRSRYQETVLAPLDEVHQVLALDVAVDFGLLAGSVNSWEGDAADNFKEYFYHPFERTLNGHKHIVEVLAGGVVAELAIVESTQHSLMNAVHYTSERLYRQLELRSLDTVDDSSTTILIIGAAVASIVAAVFSGGTSLAATLWAVSSTAVAGGLSVAATEIPDGIATTMDLLGSSAEALLGALEQAVGTIELNQGALYQKLAEEIRIALDSVREIRDVRGGEDYGPLVPIRPDVVAGVDADTFRLPDAG